MTKGQEFSCPLRVFTALMWFSYSLYAIAYPFSVAVPTLHRVWNNSLWCCSLNMEALVTKA